jgi:hypothetical protein
MSRDNSSMGARGGGEAGKGRQQTPTRDSSHKGLIVGMLLSGLILPILVSLITQDLNSPPHIDTAAAHAFLNRYFSQVTTSSQQRWDAYEYELTPNFQDFPGHDWATFQKFWQTQHDVTVDSLIPVTGNPAEYTISLAYHAGSGQVIYNETLNVWLACDSNYVLVRLPWASCAADKLKIDGTQDASGGT